MTYYQRLGWAMLITLASGCISSCTTSPPPRQGIPPSPNPTLQEPVGPPAPAPLPEPPALLPLRPPRGQEGLDALVSVSLTEGGLKELLHALAQQAQVNLVIDPDVEDDRVSLTIQKIPLWQALDAVLSSHSLYFSSHPGYVRISKMLTRIFHLDYVLSVRSGTSTTQVSLSSGSAAASTGTGAAGGTVGGTGTANVSASSGDIAVQTQESVDFWKHLEERLRELMRDPRYEILKATFDQRDLRRQMEMLPLESQYDKEVLRHQIEMFQLQREVIKKQIETGLLEGQPQAMATQAQPSRARETTSRGAEAASAEAGRAPLVGSFALHPQTGTLMVTTTPEIMDRIERFIGQVRENLSRQVHLDVQILEVSLADDNQLGIDWSNLPGLIQIFRMPSLRDVIRSQIQGQAGGGGGGGAAGGTGITSPLPASPFSASPVGALQLGLLFAPANDLAVQSTLNAIISFLQRHGNVRALSRPQITTLNNQPAVISVGVNDFFVTFEQQTTAAAAGGIATSQVTSRVNPLFIGVSLHITPQISPQGEIVMKIVPAVNQKVGDKEVPTGIPSTPTQSIPLLETRQTSTVVKVRDGQTILISGLIQEREEEVERAVPYLSGVPVVGPLFRHSTKRRNRSELVLLLTPRLTDFSGPTERVGYRVLPGER